MQGIAQWPNAVTDRTLKCRDEFLVNVPSSVIVRFALHAKSLLGVAQRPDLGLLLAQHDGGQDAAEV